MCNLSQKKPQQKHTKKFKYEYDSLTSRLVDNLSINL